MQNKSNTKTMIGIWMKACFEKLLAASTSESRPDIATKPKASSETASTGTKES